MHFIHGHNQTGFRTKTYTAWSNMWQRCTNKWNEDYKNYGGRGITVCSEWRDFTVFLKDAGESPEGLTLDRIENDKGYYKENCRWVTRAVQNENKRPQKKPSTNTSGLLGVSIKRHSFGERKIKAYVAWGRAGGVTRDLYWGGDFFEACCVRKSWEARQRET